MSYLSTEETEKQDNILNTYWHIVFLDRSGNFGTGSRNKHFWKGCWEKVEIVFVLKHVYLSVFFYKMSPKLSTKGGIGSRPLPYIFNFDVNIVFHTRSCPNLEHLNLGGCRNFDRGINEVLKSLAENCR